MTYLASFPRSGNSWVRYIVEFLSKKPTESFYNIAIGRKTDLGINIEEESILYKTHTIEPEMQHKKPLILLVRNYKEVFYRHYPKEDDVLKNLFDEFTSCTKTIGYIHLLKCFDLWQKEKLLIYYEDLIEKPKNEIKKIINFLNINNTYIDDFFNNYKYHFQNSLSIYEPGSVTKGKEIFFHSKKNRTKIKKIYGYKIKNIISGFISKIFKTI